jgi:hypothetical protein
VLRESHREKSAPSVVETEVGETALDNVPFKIEMQNPIDDPVNH